ncbi:aminoacetone oxidase family FAD-binding enzyme [Sulfurimonas sp.]|jgi:predicted Rossmann fold flavoprotein|uniref:NAD(P)/FAD-dependent oxidoreductase n=1 Tax=Sulfurimonas sp. TaxID=2022749 RepID=UPI0025D108C9|nr:aminoacetone oxidase family FAD-binding enzyme [Sulfurimonas sp.]MBT5935993.1 aminoacetone oxidase family FAD-binding enzyme [Sulfurimonas sp.]
MKIYDAIILGAGASGLMCASNIGKKKSVAVIEVNDKVAKKLKVSGGGKCNITNTRVELDNFDGDKELLDYSLKRYSRDNLLEFLDRNRVELELRKGRYYFCQTSSDEIIDVLKNASKNSEIILNTKIIQVTKENEIFEVITDKDNYTAHNVIVATGGKSFQTLGASEIGLDIAKNFDIKVKEFTPALVGLTVQKEQFWMRELSGLSCYVNIRVEDRLLKEEMLFAHKGISGPAVLSASLYWKKGNISIDFLPEQNIVELQNGSKKLISSVIPLAKRLSKALLNAVGVEDKECRKLSKNDLEQLKKIHDYSFSPAGNFGFTKAEVSRGGVLCEEIDKKSLESKKVKGLYFIGEVVDITGELGGYNFQWAFSSAYVCAKAIK